MKEFLARQRANNSMANEVFLLPPSEVSSSFVKGDPSESIDSSPPFPSSSSHASRHNRIDKQSLLGREGGGSPLTHSLGSFRIRAEPARREVWAGEGHSPKVVVNLSKKLVFSHLGAFPRRAACLSSSPFPRQGLSFPIPTDGRLYVRWYESSLGGGGNDDPSPTFLVLGKQ